MSNDLFKDNPSVFEQPKVKDDEQIVSALTEEFNQLFKREGLEQNLQIVSKMSSSLELPITSVYKDKAILQISNNLALIREALARSTSVEYDTDRGIIRPKFKALRNKIVVNKIPDQLKVGFLQLVTSSQEYSEKISEKYLDNIKSFNISLVTEESANILLEKMKSFFETHKAQVEVHLEYEDLYLNICQKAQEMYKRQVYTQESSTENPRPNQFYPYVMPNPYNYRNTPYYGYPTYGNYGGYPGYSPGYYGPNANPYAGPGSNQLFIRKAQDENTYDDQHDDYNGGGGRYGGGRRRDKNGGRRHQGERKPRNEEKKERKVISEAEINDIEKFPPLMSQGPSNDSANDMFSPSKKKVEKVEAQEEVKKVEEKKFIKIRPKAMIEEFKNLGEHVKPDTKLAGMDPAEIPVLNIGIKADLEAINPTPAKDIKETPKLNPMTPKQSFKA